MRIFNPLHIKQRIFDLKIYLLIIEIIRPKPFQCWGYFRPKHYDAKIFEKHVNPVMLLFIGKLSMSTLRWVPTCQGCSHFKVFLHHFVLVKFCTSSIRVHLLYIMLLMLLAADLANTKMMHASMDWLFIKRVLAEKKNQSILFLFISFAKRNPFPLKTWNQMI